MSGLESKIDDLYRLPLGQFTAARDALAQDVKGDEGKRIKRLPKATVVPWAINQLYWHARPVYDRLLKSGAALRAAQLAALHGRRTDVRQQSDAFRSAVATAVARATDFAAAEGSHVAADDLSRTFEALALAAEHPEQPGRLTRALAPAGFEALTGIKVASPKAAEAPGPASRSSKKDALAGSMKATAAAHRKQQEQERRQARLLEAQQKREAEEERQRRAAIAQAERALERARRDEATARQALDDARERVMAAERDLATIKQASGR